MVITFYNISEKNLRDLRTIEKRYSNETILEVTKKAFDGYEIANLIVASVEAVAAVLSTIAVWSDVTKQNKKDGSSGAKITMKTHDDEIIDVELSDVTVEKISEIMTTVIKCMREQ